MEPTQLITGPGERLRRKMKRIKVNSAGSRQRGLGQGAAEEVPVRLESTGEGQVCHLGASCRGRKEQFRSQMLREHSEDENGQNKRPVTVVVQRLSLNNKDLGQRAARVLDKGFVWLPV